MRRVVPRLVAFPAAARVHLEIVGGIDVDEAAIEMGSASAMIWYARTSTPRTSRA